MAEIREYQKSDYTFVREVLEIGALYWEPSDNEQSLERHVQTHPGSIFVATEHQSIVGTAIIVPAFMPFIFRLAVLPQFRAQGIGTQLLEHGEAYLRNKGYNHINILIAEGNREAQQRCAEKGYEEGHRYVWMTKTL